MMTCVDIPHFLLRFRTFSTDGGSWTQRYWTARASAILVSGWPNSIMDSGSACAVFALSPLRTNRKSLNFEISHVQGSRFLQDLDEVNFMWRVFTKSQTTYTFNTLSWYSQRHQTLLSRDWAYLWKGLFDCTVTNFPDRNSSCTSHWILKILAFGTPERRLSHLCVDP